MNMKRAATLLLAFAMLFAFVGCQKETKNVNVADVMAEIRDSMEFPEMMEKSEEDLAGYGYDTAEGDIVEMSYIIASSGLTPEEVFLVKAKDADTAEAVKAMMETRRDQIADMAQDYIPEEMEKVTGAVIGSKGVYAYYAVTADNSKVKEILSKAF